MQNISSQGFNDFTLEYPQFKCLYQNPIAYFSAEYALDGNLPIYSGGLGVLSGDTIREASEFGLPFIGVGLMYKHGFFTQRIENNTQIEKDIDFDPSNAGMSLLLDADGNIFKQSIPIDNRHVFFQAWEYRVGGVTMFFLDTDVDENNDYDRGITSKLYGGNKETRILQEIILGIGGEKTLFSRGIYPSLYHLNEGHSSFAILGIIHHMMKLKSLSFEESYNQVKERIVFTNHTLVSAGNDIFEVDLVRKLLADYANEVNIPVDKFISLGLYDGSFAMTIFAMNIAKKTNAVSKLHAVKAKDLWPDKELIAITNGVNVTQWQMEDLRARLYVISIEKNIPIEIAATYLQGKELELMHLRAKELLLKEIGLITGKILNSNALTICWSRRFAEYKRPELIFYDIERLKKICFNSEYPVNIVFAGKAHPSDSIGKELIHNVYKIIDDNFSNRAVFIPNYSIPISSLLVQGSDVWLNTPIRGLEACGTSGMKASLNGVLQLTVKDGWSDEVDWNGLGWEIDDKNPISVYERIEKEVVPMFFERKDEWMSMAKKTIVMSMSNFTTRRMLRDYLLKSYIECI